MLWLTGCASWFGTPETVTVNRGDTLYSLSKRYDIPLRDLIDANGLRLPTRSKSVRFSGCPPAVTICRARRHPRTAFRAVTTLTRCRPEKINDLSPPYTLAVGRKIMLRGHAAARTTATATPQNNTGRRNYTVSAVPKKNGGAQTLKFL